MMHYTTDGWYTTSRFSRKVPNLAGLKDGRTEEGRKDASKGDEQTVSQVFTLINAHDWV